MHAQTRVVEYTTIDTPTVTPHNVDGNTVTSCIQRIVKPLFGPQLL